MKEGKKVNRKEGRMEGHATNRNRTLPVYNMGELTQFKVFFFFFFVLFSSIHALPIHIIQRTMRNFKR